MKTDYSFSQKNTIKKKAIVVDMAADIAPINLNQFPSQREPIY